MFNIIQRNITKKVEVVVVVEVNLTNYVRSTQHDCIFAFDCYTHAIKKLNTTLCDKYNTNQIIKNYQLDYQYSLLK